jgi:hypothetical protein
VVFGIVKRGKNDLQEQERELYISPRRESFGNDRAVHKRKLGTWKSSFGLKMSNLMPLCLGDKEQRTASFSIHRVFVFFSMLMAFKSVSLCLYNERETSSVKFFLIVLPT